MQSHGLGTGGGQGTRRPAPRGPAKPPRCPTPRAALRLGPATLGAARSRGLLPVEGRRRWQYRAVALAAGAEQMGAIARTCREERERTGTPLFF